MVLSGGNGLHGLLFVIVVIVTTGALTESLFLFLDFLPLLAVNGISTADEVVGTGLDHACQSPEQSEDGGGGLPVDMLLYCFLPLAFASLSAS